MKPAIWHINHKVRVALDAGLDMIFCVGETLAEHQANQTQIPVEAA